ncbi:unnamed protein product [Soboliphyme baturini]|uniref:Hexosyltransferase n=1 Tax=Soboliphyme baturini TaxID=241478 RepID=A0A183IG69_9BILA|nr:unnamed protein product [Soboliphyme baturini]
MLLKQRKLFALSLLVCLLYIFYVLSLTYWYKPTSGKILDFEREQSIRELLHRSCKASEARRTRVWQMLKHWKVKFSGDRIGVLLCIPFKPNHYYTLQFLTFLYASWKVMNEHAVEVHAIYGTQSNFNKVDLLVFCEPPSCYDLPDDCVEWTPDTPEIKNIPFCYFISTKGFNLEYANVNSYCYVKTTAFAQLTTRYRYLLRTDVDVFLSPAMLLWKTDQPIVTGLGGYCVPFNMRRLMTMATRYGLRHQGVHCLGSTWFGESQLISSLSNITIALTMTIFENEFDPVRHPDIAEFMRQSPHGDWPSWWRPVSTMYAQELALNHMVDDLSKSHIKRDLIDVESCRRTSILLHPHIHTWHSDCEFSKFTFLDPLVFNVSIEEKFIIDLQYIRPTLISCFSVADYCTYVAKNALARYTKELGKLSSLFSKHKKAPQPHSISVV